MSVVSGGGIGNGLAETEISDDGARSDGIIYCAREHAGAIQIAKRTLRKIQVVFIVILILCENDGADEI